MRKISILLILSMFILSNLVFAVEPDFLLTATEVSKVDTVPLSITRTDPSKDTVKKGELISAVYELFWSQDSSKSMFQIYFISFDNKVQFVKNAYYNSPAQKGKTLRLTVNNIDTSVLPNSFCNTNVRMGGYHFVCPGLDGSCGTLSAPRTDTLQSGTVKGLGTIAEQFGWNLDFIHSGEIEGIGTSFKLLCENVVDSCSSKKGIVVEEGICFANQERRKVYSGTTSTTGQCETTLELVKDCGTGICTDGKCISRTTEQKLDDGQGCTQDGVCKSGNCIIITCGEKRDFEETCIQNNDCISNICSQNKCVKEKEVEEQTNEGESLEGTSCEASIFCDNGDILVECIDNLFGKEKTCSGTSSKTSTAHQLTEICENKFDEFDDGKCVFSFDKFSKDQTVIWSGIAVVFIIFVLVVIIIIPKQPKRGRR